MIMPTGTHARQTHDTMLIGLNDEVDQSRAEGRPISRIRRRRTHRNKRATVS
jgi:hypothetical protein